MTEYWRLRTKDWVTKTEYCRLKIEQDSELKTEELSFSQLCLARFVQEVPAIEISAPVVEAGWLKIQHLPVLATCSNFVVCLTRHQPTVQTAPRGHFEFRNLTAML